LTFPGFAHLASDDVAGGEQLAKALDDFCEFAAGSVLVGHFAAVDLKVLQKEMRSTGHKLEGSPQSSRRMREGR